jgi:TolB-like protein/tRNA A-37 threonylcarbamoyl transferase component Bud32/Flp pilus assembly protein TadD
LVLLEQLQASLGAAYTIERELGGGGMSKVFLATENRLNRKVVVKVLSPDLAAGVSADRFEREIQLAAQLQQANIVPVLATGDMNGLPYFTMPFVEGESLRARLAAERTVSISECVSILRDVARALSYAHAVGVVHRDIKPDNVLLSHGTAVVTDFGIAKALSASRTRSHESDLTQTGTSIGSPAYMAPEQVAGDPNVDHRADIYAFGCMGYELLAGEPPFTGQSPQRVLAAHLTEKPRPIAGRRTDVPPRLAAILMRCLEKNPADRPASAAEILTALESVETSGARATRGVIRDGFTPPRRWTVAAVLAVIVLAAAGASIKKFYSGRENTPTDRSVAVLPLSNLSGDKANDYFGEGLAEEITGALAKAGLRVIGRSSAFALSAKGMSAVEIARELHVGNVLQGSVQRSGESVRINVSLISTPDESVLWNERYDRSIKDVFAVQDEIAQAVASELKVKLSGNQSLRTRVDTKDPEAHTAYLQALYLWNRRSAPGLRKAIGLFADAVRRDPSYARAYGGMALAYVVLPAYDDVVNDEMISLARDAANRALALDSGIVEALTALGYADRNQYRNASSERFFRRALAIDSSFATAHFWHGLALMQQHRNNDALTEIRRARSLEPASLVINTAEAQILYDMRRYSEGEKTARRVLQLDSTFQLGIADLAKILIEEGKTDEAVSMMMPILEVPGLRRREKIGLTAYGLARAGRTREAKLMLERAKDQSDKPQSQSGIIAAALDALGEREKAIEVLRAAVRDHDLWLGHYSGAAPYDGLRKDPRVRDLFAIISAR